MVTDKVVNILNYPSQSWAAMVLENNAASGANRIYSGLYPQLVTFWGYISRK